MRGKVWGGEAIVGIVGFEPAECIVICVGGAEKDSWFSWYRCDCRREIEGRI